MRVPAMHGLPIMIFGSLVMRGFAISAFYHNLDASAKQIRGSAGGALGPQAGQRPFSAQS
jgi:hypothetical protein